jgi:hypothetical protein
MKGVILCQVQQIKGQNDQPFGRAVHGMKNLRWKVFAQ